MSANIMKALVKKPITGSWKNGKSVREPLAADARLTIERSRFLATADEP
jgi:hypothetical protein